MTNTVKLFILTCIDAQITLETNEKRKQELLKRREEYLDIGEQQDGRMVRS